MASNTENGLLLRHPGGPIVAIVMAIGSLVAWGYWWPPSFFGVQQATLSFPARGLSTGRGEIALAAAIVLIAASLLFFVPRVLRIAVAVVAILALVVLLVDAGTALSSSISSYQHLNAQFQQAQGGPGQGCQSVFDVNCVAAGYGSTDVMKHSVLPGAAAAVAGFFALLALLFMLSDTIYFLARRRAEGAAEPAQYVLAAASPLATYPPPVPRGDIQQVASPRIFPTSSPEPTAMTQSTTQQPRCPHCGADMIPASVFCGQCGSNLSPQAAVTHPPPGLLITQESHGTAAASDNASIPSCATCGEMISPGIAFCGSCGARVTPVAT